MATHTRPFFRILFVLLVLFGVHGERSAHHPSGKNSASALERKSRPNEHFWMVRSWPDTVMDIEGYRQAVRIARERGFVRNARPAGFDVPWRLEGPVNIAGRINTIAVHPHDHDIIYVGLATGGIFKTTDGGKSWTAIFDDQSHLAIGHVVIDPQDPDVIYAGTGDRNIPGLAYAGDGVWKSADGGATWIHVGLAEQSIISKIIVHPKDPGVIYAATMGRHTERNQHRGLYKTTDGGASWSQVLFVSEQAGITDLVMHPATPDTLYAASWNRFRSNQETLVAGPDAHIYKTTNGGDTWTILEGGLPTDTMGRIGLTISPNNPDWLYALYVNPGSQLEAIYRTVNGGQSWFEVPQDDLPFSVLGGFGWYFGRIEVNPANDEEIWVCGVNLWRTTNGGDTWNLGAPEWWEYEVHADKHDIVFLSPDTILLATDGGLSKSTDGGETWEFISPFPSIQFYRVAVNPHIPHDYWGGAQDNGTLRGSYSAPDAWERAFGGDGFQVLFDPSDPEAVYAQTQNGGIWISENGGASFDEGDLGIDGSDRRNWDMPMIISGHFPEVLYTGTYRLYTNGSGTFPSWIPGSPDLTDGIIYEPRFHNISAIEESPMDYRYIYVGTSDGNVWFSPERPDSWVDITQDLPDRYVTSIHASHLDPATVWVTHSGYKYNDFFPHIHKSTDYGQTWTPVHGDLPPLGINKVLSYPEDENILFVATDGGIYATLDGGLSWHRLGSDMPIIPVFDITIDPITNRLVAGTHARSMMSFPIDSILAPPTSTKEYQHKPLHLTLSPNPASDYTVVSVEEKSNTDCRIVLMNSDGKVMREIRKGSDDRIQIPVGDLGPGIYVVHWESGVRTGSEKLMVFR